MYPLKVLHVASFTGNIGDNANHMGFRPWFENLCGKTVEWTQLEIRHFYWGERHWDQDFVELANSHDCVVIGGGNYFELWVEHSPTGTSIAIAPDVFKKITTPIFFNALGVDAGQGANESSLQRFRSFLDTLTSDNQYLVSVRNDGAYENLRRFVGNHYAEHIKTIPDAGFFVPNPPMTDESLAWLKHDGNTIGINLACDMPHIRFDGYSQCGGRQGFSSEFATAINAIAHEHPDTRFVFFPHIFSDLEIISETIRHLNDRLRRSRVVVAPYTSGDRGTRTLISAYSKCSVVLGTRFHANVCSLGIGVQTIGLVNYPQIEHLYSELAVNERTLDIRNPGFAPALTGMVCEALSDPDSFGDALAAIKLKIEAQRTAFEKTIKIWLEKNDLVCYSAREL